MGLFDGDRNAGRFPRQGQHPSLFNLAAATQPHEPGTTTFTRNVPIQGRVQDSFELQWTAIKRIEGGNNPDGSFRTSPAGAVGPAQIRPRTAPEAARLAGLQWDERRYRTDPEYNEALGRAYYRQQLRDFGDPVLAVAAYNWGPTNLRAAIRDSRRTGRPLKEYLPGATLKYIGQFSRSLADE